MPKRVSRKLSSYINLNQSQPQNQEQAKAGESATVIAKSLLQTQPASDNVSQQNNSQEMVELLRKINSQLELLQKSLAGNQSGVQNQQPAQNQQQQQSPGQAVQQGWQPDASLSQELSNLFSMLLQNGGQGTSPSNSRQGQSQQTGQAGNSEASNKTALQATAQSFDQAQYELSNELEVSLKKLRQVISESKKIASKISNLLGEENS